jgi:hypothetical protein
MLFAGERKNEFQPVDHIICGLRSRCAQQLS